MTEEKRQYEGGEDIGFERQDLKPKTIFAFLIGLALVAVIIHFVLTGLYGYMDAYYKTHQPPQNPLIPQTRSDTREITPADVTKFPQPRLETNERSELFGFRLQEEQTLESYGWVDQKDGIVHIPIDRAMQLIAERGLPTRPQAGTVPPSAVNRAEQAARRSDTSRTAPQPPQERKK